MFLQGKNFPLFDVFEDFLWLGQLTYQSDIFSHLKEPNLGLQGVSLTAFDVQNNNKHAFYSK